MSESIHGYTAIQRRRRHGRDNGPAARELLAQGVMQQSVAYHGGPLLQAVTTRAAFLGGLWNTDPHAALRAQLDDYLSYLVTSDVMDNLAEYGTNGMTIGHGGHAESVVLDQLEVGATVSDDAIQAALDAAIAVGTLGAPDVNTLYIAFAPEGTTVTTASIGNSCERMCGYHGVLSSGVAYAVIGYPGCAGCQVAGSVFDGLTSVVSHEICEAVTNPQGTGWYAEDGSEIGDLCAVPTWQTRRSGDYVVQKEFSQTHKECR